MGKYFGTDGIRGRNEIFTNVVLTCIASSLIKTINKEKVVILIGGDTRKSTKHISGILAKELSIRGADVLDAGIIPTPAISFLTSKYKADCSIIITASHNPYTDNGIKILNQNGEKLSDDLINVIENYIDTYRDNDIIKTSGKIKNIHEKAIDDYLNHLLSSISSDLKGLKIGIDCANGATSIIAEKLFSKLNAEYILINNNWTYNNVINKDCGSTHLEGIKKLVQDKNLDFGVAYDGDGDRCLMITNTGKEIDGDHILGILSNHDKKQKKLVITVMANQGLINYAKDSNIDLIITNVGDTLVYEAMKENNIDYGGEQSGHIILRNKKMRTGDGLLTSIVIGDIIKKSNKSLDSLASIVQKLPQIITNVKADADAKESFKTSIEVSTLIREYENILKKEKGRINVRPSGTENLIRITMWGEHEDYIKKQASELAKKLERIISK
ncbi:MAG: phosphoglucosamine mutase [Bacilli bacterium]|nr:phosphoglucosamine mutase [Bacilli bacterium]